MNATLSFSTVTFVIPHVSECLAYSSAISSTAPMSDTTPNTVCAFPHSRWSRVAMKKSGPFPIKHTYPRRANGGVFSRSCCPNPSNVPCNSAYGGPGPPYASTLPRAGGASAL